MEQVIVAIMGKGVVGKGVQLGEISCGERG